jgi:DNA repair photolyase
MHAILDKLLERPDLQRAHLAGAAVRGEYGRAPRETIAGLASWSAHPNPFARIASGIGYGVLGTRDRNLLTEILPFVERLANDADAEVRLHGAQTALERLWLVHPDAIWTVAENWAAEKNDTVREVVAWTIARLSTSNQINRPSMLRRFIERGMTLFDAMIPTASVVLRNALAECVDEIGCMAPELASPVVLAWAAREDSATLRLVLRITRLPFGGACEGLDAEAIAGRVKAFKGASQAQVASWLRRGGGRIDYLSIVASEFVIPQPSDTLPWTHFADPYRGCQLRCEFCNARTGAEWSGDDLENFVRRITVVQNAASLLSTELEKTDVKPRNEHVLGVGITSDPYQPAEERFRLTRDVLKTCLALEHPVIVQTRQELILRDADLLAKLAERDLVNVLFSFQSPVEGIRNKIELGTSLLNERGRAMKTLAERGIPVGLLLSPIMPELTDHEELLEQTIQLAREHGASWVVSEVLNLHGSARAKLRTFIGSYIAQLLPKYKELYTTGAKVGDPDPEYLKRITEAVAAFAEKHGVNDTSRMLTSGRDAATCLARL